MNFAGGVTSTVNDDHGAAQSARVRRRATMLCQRASRAFKGDQRRIPADTNDVQPGRPEDSRGASTGDYYGLY